MTLSVPKLPQLAKRLATGFIPSEGSIALISRKSEKPPPALGYVDACQEPSPPTFPSGARPICRSFDLDEFLFRHFK
jgi:hypothetical protein